MIESFNTQPLPNVIPAYVYDQYSDDENVQGFFEVLNAMAQGYLDWFNQTPLPLYTNPNINGPLLDWVGNSLYNIPRPVISDVQQVVKGALATVPLTALPIAGFQISESGTSAIATDDIYKRVLTWFMYRGDGMQMSVEWLRRRVARFLYGTNGTDIPDVGLLSTVQLTRKNSQVGGVTGTDVTGLAVTGLAFSPIYHTVILILPSYSISAVFQELVQTGVIPLPFQITLEIVTGFALNQTELNVGTL